STLHPEGVAGRARGRPVPLPLVLASPSLAYPSHTAWRRSPSPSTLSGGPRRRASWQAAPLRQSTLPYERGRGTWPEKEPRRRGSWGGHGGSHPKPSGRAVARGLQAPPHHGG